MEDLQLCTNETLIKILKIQREQIKILKNAFMISVFVSLINILIIAGGILYFLNNYSVVIIDNTSIESVKIN